MSCTTHWRLTRKWRANSVPGTGPLCARIHSRMRRRRVLPESGRPFARPFRARVLVAWGCLVTCLMRSLVTVNYSTALTVPEGYKFDAYRLNCPRKAPPSSDNRIVMRMLGLLFAAVIAMGIYYFYLKQAAPAPGMLATQAITTTGVEMDLNAIAQAERTYFAQNGSYADLEQLTSSGALTMARSGRDGYTYSIETSGNGFTASARHSDSPAVSGVAPLHYPAISIDQNMQMHQE